MRDRDDERVGIVAGGREPAPAHVPGCLLLEEEQTYSAKKRTLEFRCRIAGDALRGVCVAVARWGHPF